MAGRKLRALRILVQRTFEGCMKEEASSAHEQVSNKGNEENSIMAMFSAALNTKEREIHEEEVREGVYYLGSIRGRVVIL